MQADGSKCDFWFWEEDYIKHLKKPKTQKILEELEAEEKKKLGEEKQRLEELQAEYNQGLAVDKEQSKKLNMEKEEGKNRDSEFKEFLQLAKEVVALMKGFLVVLVVSLLLIAYAVIRG